ncbi:DUF3667 domain-containing protein [Flavilitoribacter nigricans]|uniref:DUF3667 domain-containing protein n=1 Tax=Flavilitoribacter nigricans TaxID=70997 RepID=UPI001473C81E|nr:DUF3667 domain-containing protein [Flavilitoribacter nigricans]
MNRINLTTVLHELSEGVFQVNRGFFYTLKALFTRPGKSLQEYLNGKRKDHFKPVAYVLTWSTLYFLIAQLSGQNTWIDDLITGWMNGAAGLDSASAVPKIATWFAKNYAYTSLLLLPLFSLASYLSFSKFGKNFLEHLVVNTYLTGQQAIIYALFAIGRAVTGWEILEPFSLLTAIGYTFWVFWQFFSEGNRIMNILRTLLTYVWYLIFCVGLSLLLVLIDKL